MERVTSASMDPLIEKAKTDYAELTAEIKRLSDKAGKLKAFLDIYDEDAPAPKVTRPGTEPIFMVPIITRPPSAQEANTAKAKITNAVAQILSDGKPRHTRDLLDILKEQNLEPGATDKIIGLSNLLSRDDRFVADRSIGWSLKK